MGCQSRLPVVVSLMAMVLVPWLTRVEAQSPMDSGMNEVLRTTIVRTHNTYRTMVRATNMLGLRWSAYLEQEAAKWVDKCNFVHQDDPQWGENIYRSEFNRTELSIVITGINSWNLERSFVSANSCCDAMANTTLCCNYQQMVWAQTRDVGCALKKCARLSATDLNYDNAWFFACYYQPRGNVAGFKPYNQGIPCSACPWTYDQCERNLCYPSLFCKGNL